MHSNSLMEYVLVNFRWVFVVFFLLPCTMMGKVWATFEKNAWSRRRSTGLDHEKKVENIQCEVRHRKVYAPNHVMCTARPSWRSMTLAEMTYKKCMFNINVHLDKMISIDSHNRTVRVEPSITVGQLIPILIQSGWTVPVALELEDLTIGGLVMGIGLESSSFKFGLFHKTCTRYELVTADGDLITCSEAENPDVFESIPFSYGTLGFLTAIDIRIMPAKKYVRLQYRPISSLEKIQSSLISETLDTENNDFVELLMYSKNDGVLMTGKMTDGNQSMKNVNEIGRFYKPWFFKHVESFLLSQRNAEEYIPLKDYYFRHNNSLFWEVQDIIPFGNHIVFRYLLGWIMPAKVALLKLTQTDTIKKLYDEHHFIDDFILPISCLKKSVEKFHEHLNIYPIWVCPAVLNPGYGLVHSHASVDNMYIDIGLYGEPNVSNYNSGIAKDLELFVLKLKGFKMMYVGTHLNRNEFKKMFNHCLYQSVRMQLNCEYNFPEVYDKVNKKVRR
ncbi:delta(24)-sterol reductase-like isoform X3 [Myzus persicae]|nr:delta(24)-sterol reductase-like isoform X3 [Myzus persicae]XP_022165329.1 delta(24)-sterol reductase-like isoform X3 [Myzus persicae]XP_022165330.1 delta(24)-sterol reductase-like isoform X3 [Myzus persicae]XP_022165331.1 delta(24)-sterol reductase-like isoform X3 [Myzus persicae]